MGSLTVVVGGQYGSEGKGAATAFLARKAAKNRPTAVVRVAGPNAGHTAYDDHGGRWALRQVPVGVVAPTAQLFIAAGSEVDPGVLLGEIDALREADLELGSGLVVDPQATVVTDEYRKNEASLVGAIGSTGKGIGGARAARIMRTAKLVGEDKDLVTELADRGVVVDDVNHRLYDVLQRKSGDVIIEGTQGYGLGLHQGYYPQCTSSDCRAIDFLSMAGVDPNWADDYRVVLVARTYPIRVAGNSGPLKDETSWEELGLAPEHTTVTKKVRRVGAWDAALTREAVWANGGRKVVEVFLSMVDYLVPGVAGRTEFAELDNETLAGLADLVEGINLDLDADVYWVGTGPNSVMEVVR